MGIIARNDKKRCVCVLLVWLVVLRVFIDKTFLFLISRTLVLF